MISVDDELVFLGVFVEFTDVPWTWLPPERGDSPARKPHMSNIGHYITSDWAFLFNLLDGHGQVVTPWNYMNLL
jgi:hypothetical protein